MENYNPTIYQNEQNPNNVPEKISNDNQPEINPQELDMKYLYYFHKLKEIYQNLKLNSKSSDNLEEMFVYKKLLEYPMIPKEQAEEYFNSVISVLQ